MSSNSDFFKNRHFRIYDKFENEIKDLARSYDNREQFLRDLFPEAQFRYYQNKDNLTLYNQFISIKSNKLHAV